MLIRLIGYGLMLALELLVLALILLVGVGGALLYRPEWIVNESNLRFAAKHILPYFDVELDFGSFQADFPRKSIAERSIILHVEDLYVSTADLQMEWPLLHLETEINIEPKAHFLTSVGPIEMKDGKVHLLLPPEDPRKKEEPFTWDPALVERIRAIKWNPLKVNLAELWVEQKVAKKMNPKTLLRGPLGVKLAEDPASSSWQVVLDSGRIQGTPLRKGKLALDIELPKADDQFYPIDVRLDSKVSLDQGMIRLKGSANIQSLDDIRYRLEAGFQQGRIDVKALASGFFENGKFAVQLSGETQNPIDLLREARIDRCRIEGLYNLKGPTLLDTKNACDIEIRRTLLPEEQEFADLTPSHLMLKINGPFVLKLKGKETYFEAQNVRARLDPIGNSVYNLDASAKASIQGALGGDASKITSQIEVDSRLALPEFKALEARLRPTAYAIPAPLHTFEGPVACVIKGSIKNQGEQITLPVSCRSNLHSSVQDLVMNVDGTLETWLSRKPRLTLAVVMQQVTLELPKLKIDDPLPQFLLDGRIQKGVQVTEVTAEPKPLPIELQVSIATASGSPARIITHHIAEPIPLDLDLKIAGDVPQTSGSVAINRYDVAFFKKKAFIDHLKLVLDPAQDSPGLDGLFVFKDPDYRIQMKLQGTIDRPFYVLESQPARNPNEVLSMILFGKEPDLLDEESQASVDETRAAMVDGAIGLVSMFYLASTPIDSIGYNPYTGVFRARMKIAQGLSLSIGSDLGGDRQTVGLRKRLTENWSFETTAETDEETNEAKGVALFKWGRRY